MDAEFGQQREGSELKGATGDGVLDACWNTCNGRTCDYWVHQADHTCEDEEEPEEPRELKILKSLETGTSNAKELNKKYRDMVEAGVYTNTVRITELEHIVLSYEENKLKSMDSKVGRNMAIY